VSVCWRAPIDPPESGGGRQQTDGGAVFEQLENKPRRARHRARRIAPQPCIRLNPRKDSHHEAVIRFSGEAPRDGTILSAASQP
jgi:hypothetical protein